MKTSRQLRIKLVSILLGLGATLLIAVCFYAGLLKRFEFLALDFRFRYFGNAKDSAQLCIIGIDDGSLESIGQWPWPRTYIAKIISLTKQLGARDILIDLIFRKPRLANIGNECLKQSEDDILAESCKENGGVVLACFFEKPALSDSEKRLISALSKDITVSMEALSNQYNIPIEKIRNRFATIRRLAVRRAILKIVSDNPSFTIEDVIKKLIPMRETISAGLRKEITSAYHYVQSYLIIRDKAGWLINGKLPASVPMLSDDVQMVLPIPKLAVNCSDAGFVSFNRDIDGKIREITLLAYYKKRIYRQIAFATLCDELKFNPKNIRMRDTSLEMILSHRKSDDISVRIPLTRKGKLIINWYAPIADKWQRSFRNMIPAAAVLELAFNIERLTQYKTLLTNARLIAVREFSPDMYQRYKTLVKRKKLLMMGSEYLLHKGSSSQPATQSTQAKQSVSINKIQPLEQNIIDDFRRTEKQIKEIEEKAIEQLDWLYEQVSELPFDKQSSKENSSIKNLWQAIHQPEILRREIVQLQTDVERQKEHIKPMIEDKIILLGYTASTLADFVSTPVFKECPGIIVHANILNQIFQQSFLIRSDYNSNLLLILIVGMLMSLISSEKSSLAGFAWLLFVLIGFYIVGCFVLFRKFHIIVPLVAPTLAVILSWMSISIYKEVTEGRTRRMFANRLRQYTNDSLVKQIIDDPDNLVLSPEERNVSCFFSDLAGFTSLSEKLGPEQTVRLLNIYLEHMSEVLDKYQAFINKFQGDGIFAFFNPPLNPQPDYALRACLSAIDSQEYLPHIQEHLEHEIPKLDRKLKMRIGIGSGLAVVGDCGSTRKFDYTCLGDTVNFSARLESANKFFGTQILICGKTKQLVDELACDSELLARLVGKVKVVGKEQASVVYELVGYKSKHIEKIEFIELFEQMIYAYWIGDFHKANQLITKLEKISPSDKSVALYKELIKIVMHNPEQFNDGVVSLESK